MEEIVEVSMGELDNFLIFFFQNYTSVVKISCQFCCIEYFDIRIQWCRIIKMFKNMIPMDENGTKFIPKLSKALPSSTKSTSIFFSISLAGSIGSMGSSVTISASCVVNNSVELSDSPITSARPVK